MSLERDGNDDLARKSAGTAGAAIGALLVLLAKSFRPPWNEALQLISPGVAVSLSAIIVYLRIYFVNWLEQKAYERRIDHVKQQIAEAMDNPMLSDIEKDQIRMQMVVVEKLNVERSIKNLKKIK